MVVDTAKFSPCGKYRYELTRELGGKRPLVVCGLNPSTATAEEDDPTIRREIGFARFWGLGRLVKVNAYGYRATDPNDMKAALRAGVDIVGPENDWTIRRAINLARSMHGTFLVAWGNHIEPERQRVLWRMIGEAAMCLKTNANGSPTHPLYLPYETALQRWVCPL